MKIKTMVIVAVLAMAAFFMVATSGQSEAEDEEETLKSITNSGVIAEYGEFTEGTFFDYSLSSVNGIEQLYYIDGYSVDYVTRGGSIYEYLLSSSAYPVKSVGDRFAIKQGDNSLYILNPDPNHRYDVYSGSPAMMQVLGVDSYQPYGDALFYTAVAYSDANGYTCVALFASTGDPILSWYKTSNLDAVKNINFLDIKCGGNYAVLSFDGGLYVYTQSQVLHILSGLDMSLVTWDIAPCGSSSTAFYYAFGSSTTDYITLKRYDYAAYSNGVIINRINSFDGYVSDMDVYYDTNVVMLIKTDDDKYQPIITDMGYSLISSSLTAIPGSMGFSTLVYANMSFALGMIDQEGNFKIAKFVSGSTTVNEIVTIANLGDVKRAFGYSGYTVFYTTVEAPETYTVTFTANDPTYGSISPAVMYNVPVNSEIQAMIDGTMVIGTTTITATPATATAQYTYAFNSWSVANGTLVTEDMTITATFTRTVNSYTITWNIDGVTTTETYGYGSTPVHANPTKSGYSFTGWDPTIVPVTQNATYTATWGVGTHAYWTNNLQNATITIGMVLDNGSTHTMIFYMDKYNGVSESTHQAIWQATSYKLVLTFSYGNHDLKGSANLYNGSTLLATYNNVSFGDWASFVIVTDLSGGAVIINGVKFDADGYGVNFQDYEIFTSKVLCDYSAVAGASGALGMTTKKIEHDGPTTALFSILDTRVFFDSYGLVMTNPSINLDQTFPSYTSARLSFYGFAVYGTSITINSQTYLVTDGKVTVTYATKSDGTHVLPSALPTATTKTKTMVLSNIYVSWDYSSGHVSLTFVDDRFTMDLGNYTVKTVSFSGSWWFTTELWSASSSTVKQIGSWKALPDLTSNQFVLLFLGCLLLLGTAAFIAARQSSGLVDIIIMVLSAVVSILLLKM